MAIISFGSTYRIPVTQAGVNSSKKEKLRTLIESYPNGSIGKSKTGYARVSVPEELDNSFEAKLKGLGYRVFQKFDAHDLSKDDMDKFIKEKLDTRDYSQKGKNKKRLSRDLKEKSRYERRFTPPKEKTSPVQVDSAQQAEVQFDTNKEQVSKQLNNKAAQNNTDSFDTADFQEKIREKENTIRQSNDYIRIKSLYGEEFADALYFGIDK